MDLASFYYEENKGWSVKSFPDMDSGNTFILIFSAPEYIDNQEPLNQLIKRYPNSKIIGCSSAGEIAGSLIRDKSIVVSVARFHRTTLATSVAEINNAEGSFLAGENIAQALIKDDLKGIFVLSEGLNVNGTDLVNGLNSRVNKDVIVTGGLAADGDRFKKTWAIHQNEIRQNLVVAIGFYGDNVIIGHGSRGGWDIFGPERHITSSKSNILYELDNKPALALYKEYLGERASGLPATGLLFPLAIRKDSADTRQLVRTILSVDEAAQSLTFAGDVPKGYLAQLMRANFDRLILGANEAGQVASEAILKNGILHQGPVLAIAVSCVGRRLLLGQQTEEETETTLSSLPPGTQQIGFYSYGELSPYATGSCDLHNQTMTLTTIVEK